MARDMGTIAVPVDDLTCRLHIKVTGMAGYRLRLWIATRLMLLGAKIGRFGGIEFEDR